MIQKADCVQAGWQTTVTVTLETCNLKINCDKNAFWKLSMDFMLHCNLLYQVFFQRIFKVHRV